MNSSNPNEKYAQSTGVAVGTWSSDLFDCFDDFSGCCLTFWCPCITFGRISEIVDKGSSSCAANGALFFLIHCVIRFVSGYNCVWTYTYTYRSKMREQFNIEGSPSEDCFVHCCCLTCALCQEYRELKNRGFDVSAGWEGNANRGVAMVTTAPLLEGGMKR